VYPEIYGAGPRLSATLCASERQDKAELMGSTLARTTARVTTWAVVALVVACGPDLPDDLPALMDLMNRDDMEYHVNASNKVSEVYGKDGLLYVLRNGRRKARYRAARWLWRFPGDDVEQALCHIVDDDSDSFLRIQALFSLERLGTERAMPTVEIATHDSDELVASSARDALWEIQSRARMKLRGQ
jgi:hypothetical protein